MSTSSESRRQNMAAAASGPVLNRVQARTWITYTHNRIQQIASGEQRGQVHNKAQTILRNWSKFTADDTDSIHRSRSEQYLRLLNQIITNTAYVDASQQEASSEDPGPSTSQGPPATTQQNASTQDTQVHAGQANAPASQPSRNDGMPGRHDEGGRRLSLGQHMQLSSVIELGEDRSNQQMQEQRPAGAANLTQTARPLTAQRYDDQAMQAGPSNLNTTTHQAFGLPPTEQSRIHITTAEPSMFHSTPHQPQQEASARFFNQNQAGPSTYQNMNANYQGLITQPQGTVMQPNVQTGAAVMPNNAMNYKVIDRLLPQTKFTGELAQWPQFWRTFEQVIHFNPNLDYLSKVSYLRFSLAGEPATMICRYSTDQRGYERAIEVLKEKYNQLRLVRIDLISKFEPGENPIENDFDYEKIANLVRSLQAVVAELEAMNTEEWVYNEQLLPKVFPLAPPCIRLRMAADNHIQFWTFLRALVRYKDGLQANLHMMPPHMAKPDAPARKRPHPEPRRVMRTKSFKQSISSQPSSKQSSALSVTPARSCWLCENLEHVASQCTEYKTAQARVNRVQQLDRCARCARRNHEIDNCPNTWIKCAKCSGPHLNWMCVNQETAKPKKKYSSRPAKGQRNLEQQEPAAETSGQASSDALLVQNDNNVFLKIVAAKAIGKQTTNIRILLDDAAHHCFVTKRLCKEMNWKTSEAPAMNVNGFGGMTVMPVKKRAKILLATENDRSKFECDAYVVEKICGPLVCAPSRRVYDLLSANKISVNKFVWTKSASVNDEVDILLGSAVLQVVQTGEMTRLSRCLSVVRTIFGHCLTGSEEMNCQLTSLTLMEIPDVQIKGIDVSKLWAAEGLSEPTEEKLAEELIRKVKQSLKLEDNRYSIGLPWFNKPDLGDNFSVAARRLRHLNENLRITGKLEEYEQALMQLQKDGYAEKVNHDSHAESYYMPHHGVWRDHSSTKLRIVFDMSSHRKENESLNEKLSKGVNLNPLLHQLLMKFRHGKYAVTADLKQAFHQIRIHENDRNYLKFLWLNDANHIITYRMTSVPFGSTSSPFLLGLVIKTHLENHAANHPIANHLHNNIYVDDILLTTNNVADLHSIKSETENLFTRCSMSVHKWRTSHKETNSQWTGDNHEAQANKVLGVVWNLNNDELSVDFNPLPFTKVTKRTILRQLGSLYDPPGIAGPVVMKFKAIFRSAFKQEERTMTKRKGESVDWDEPVDESLALEFRKAVQSLATIQRPSIPRCTHTDPQQAALVIFTDACKTGYGAAAYVLDFAGRKTATLLKSKSKVSPLNHPRTMNELELQGALLGAELYAECVNATSINRAIIYTDSTTVLHWLVAHPNRLRPFVNNRIDKIMKHTSANQWQFVEGTQNPADMLSRGDALTTVSKTERWVNPPSFVQQLQLTDFPMHSSTMVIPPAVQRRNALSNQTNVNSWSELLKIALHKGYRSSLTRYMYLMREIQRMDFNAEILAIKSGSRLPIGSKLRNKVLFVDNFGVLRAKTRFNTKDDDFNNPMILDGKNRFVQLWARHLHVVFCHLSAKRLRDVLTEKHFILGATDLAKKAASCESCLRDRTRPLNPPPGPLPAWRTQSKHAFNNVGLDFFGPIPVHPTGSRKGTTQNRYGLLFTCAVTRAVHIEITLDTSAKSVWDAIRQFVSRRGPVKLMYSDNATCFRRTAKDITLLASRLKDKVEKDGDDIRAIRWIFTAPNSPWQGGFYERLVGEFKKHFRRTVTAHPIDDQELRVLATEIEAVMNSRPLGLLPDGTLLQPSHFLIGGSFTNLPEFSNNQEVPSTLKAFQARRRALNGFWRAWRTTYLANLQGRYAQPGSTKRLLIGQTALVKDAALKRNQWKVAEIVEELASKDGHCRNYKVKIGNDNFIRSAQNLVPFELDVVGADVASRPPTGGLTEESTTAADK